MLCKKRQPHYLRYPIWALTCYKDCVLVSGGGGGQSFGIKNKLSLFKRMAKFEDPLAELDTQNELAAYLDWAQELDVVVACIGTDTAVYRIEQRRQVLRFTTEPAKKLQKIAIISIDNSFLLAGGDSGTVSFWSLSKALQQKPLFAAPIHTSEVTSGAISPDQMYACTTSNDKTCKVFELKPKILLIRTLSLSLSPGLPPLTFRSCLFATDSKKLITLSIQAKSGSYVTEWNCQEGFLPVESFKVHDHPSCQLVLDPFGQQYILGGNNGVIQVMSANDYKCRYSRELFEMPVTGVSVQAKDRVVVVGSADYSYEVIALPGGSGWRLWLVLAVLAAVVAALMV